MSLWLCTLWTTATRLCHSEKKRRKDKWCECIQLCSSIPDPTAHSVITHTDTPWPTETCAHTHTHTHHDIQKCFTHTSIQHTHVHTHTHARTHACTHAHLPNTHRHKHACSHAHMYGQIYCCLWWQIISSSWVMCCGDRLSVLVEWCAVVTGYQF